MLAPFTLPDEVYEVSEVFSEGGLPPQGTGLRCEKWGFQRHLSHLTHHPKPNLLGRTISVRYFEYFIHSFLIKKSAKSRPCFLSS